MIPIFLLLLTPLAAYLWRSKPWSWRVWYFAALNFPLLFLTSFNISEASMLGAIRYVHDHAEIDKVVGVDGFYLFPSAFILRPVEHRVVGWDELKLRPVTDCREVLAVHSADLADHPWFRTTYRRLAESQPGPLEALLIRLNPKRNARRGPISIWSNASCALQALR